MAFSERPMAGGHLPNAEAVQMAEQERQALVRRKLRDGRLDGIAGLGRGPWRLGLEPVQIDELPVPPLISTVAAVVIDKLVAPDGA